MPAPTSEDAKKPLGQIEKGHIDLTKQPEVKNPDGSISTVRSITVEMDGQHIILPTVHPDGHIMGQAEAIGRYLDTGKHLGKFDTQEAADLQAQAIHEQEAERIRPKTTFGQVYDTIIGALQSLKGLQFKPGEVEDMFIRTLAPMMVNRGKVGEEALRLPYGAGYDDPYAPGYNQALGMRKPIAAAFIGPETAGNIAKAVGTDVQRLLAHTATRFVEAWKLLERGYEPSDPAVVERVADIAGFGNPMARGPGFAIDRARMFPLPGEGKLPPIPNNIIGDLTKIEIPGKEPISLLRMRRTFREDELKPIMKELRSALDEGRNTIQVETRDAEGNRFRTGARVTFEPQESARAELVRQQERNAEYRQMNMEELIAPHRKGYEGDPYAMEQAFQDSVRRREQRAESRYILQERKSEARRLAEDKAAREVSRPPVVPPPYGRFPQAQTGFYSKAEEVIHNLEKDTLKPSEALSLIEQSGVKESEIRALNLDRKLIGDSNAALRRQIIDVREYASEARKAIQQGAERAPNQEIIDTAKEFGKTATKEMKTRMADLRKTEGNISRADLADYAADNATIISERDRMVGDNQVRNASNTADPNNPTMIGKTLTIEDAPMQRY